MEIFVVNRFEIENFLTGCNSPKKMWCSTSILNEIFLRQRQEAEKNWWEWEAVDSSQYFPFEFFYKNNKNKNMHHNISAALLKRTFSGSAKIKTADWLSLRAYNKSLNACMVDKWTRWISWFRCSILVIRWTLRANTIYS